MWVSLVVGSTALVALASAAALAQGGGAPVVGTSGNAPPITINSCGPLTKPSGQTVAGFPVGSTSAGFKIEFVNESTKPAVLVNFAVDSNGERFVIRDVGTFSPGVSIVHQYRNGAGQSFILPQFIAPSVDCKVASVKFADGTFWRRGQSSAPAQPAPSTVLNATPASLALAAGSEADLVLVSGHMSGAFKEIDDCASVAAVTLVATGDSAVTYSVRPLAAGSCTARVIDEDGHTIAIPIAVR